MWLPLACCSDHRVEPAHHNASRLAVQRCAVSGFAVALARRCWLASVHCDWVYMVATVPVLFLCCRQQSDLSARLQPVGRLLISKPGLSALVCRQRELWRCRGADGFYQRLAVGVVPLHWTQGQQTQTQGQQTTDTRTTDNRQQTTDNPCCEWWKGHPDMHSSTHTYSHIHSTQTHRMDSELHTKHTHMADK